MQRFARKHLPERFAKLLQPAQTIISIELFDEGHDKDGSKKCDADGDPEIPSEGR
jgi:hypothetical protein